MPEIVVLTASQSAELDPRESGFAHGFGIFETMKLASGRLFLFEEHWQRLVSSAQSLGLDCAVAKESVLAGVSQLVRVDRLSDAVIKLSLLREGDQTKLFVYSRPSHTCPKSISLQLRTDAPVNERSLLAGHKTHNYMENLLLLMQAKAQGYSDVLRVNTVGELAETTVGNFFFVRNRKLYTPALRCGILPGTRRELVLQLARELQLDVVEAAFRLDGLSNIEGAFVTNASVGVLPVHAMKGAGVTYASDGQLPEMLKLSSALSDYEAEHRIDV